MGHTSRGPRERGWVDAWTPRGVTRVVTPVVTCVMACFVAWLFVTHTRGDAG